MTGEEGLYGALLARGLSRRTFLKWCSAMAGVLALPATYAPRIAAAVEAAPRFPLIWLRGQDCGGDTTAFLRSGKPSTAELLIETLSVEYHESLMAAQTADPSTAIVDAIQRYPNGYLAVVEGSIPTAEGGTFCLVGGRPFVDIVRDVTAKAAGTIAVGGCAADGGAPSAAGGATGASGVESVATGGRLINLPGCPVNVENLAATIVHFVTFKEFPPTDGWRRPLFAYGGLIHNQCERRAHFEFGEFSTAWGDEAAQKGWCLYKVGCKGPETYANCPTVRYGEGRSWPVKAGHGCIGCHSPHFWDAMGDAYLRLPSPTFGLAPTITVDQLGGALVGGVGALTVAHATGMTAVLKLRAAGDRRRAAKAAAEAAAGGDATTTSVPEAEAAADQEASAAADLEAEAAAESEVVDR